MIVSFQPKLANKIIHGIGAGIRFNGFEWVNWRKEKKRKRKLELLNKSVVNRIINCAFAQKKG